MAEGSEIAIWTSIGVVVFFTIKVLVVVFFGGWALNKLMGRRSPPSQPLQK